MVAAALKVAGGEMSKADLVSILENPDPDAWHKHHLSLVRFF